MRLSHLEKKLEQKENFQPWEKKTEKGGPRYPRGPPVPGTPKKTSISHSMQNRVNRDDQVSERVYLTWKKS